MNKKCILSIIMSVSVLLPGFVFGSEPTIDSVGTNIIDQSGTVYMIATENGQTVRRPYTSAGAFLSYGFNSFNKLSTNPHGLSYPIGSFIPPQDGKIICSDRGADKGTCYLISQSQKLGFPSASIFTAQGFNINHVLYGDISFLPTGGIIANSNQAHNPGVIINKDGTLYFVGNNGTLWGFPSATVFTGWGYSFADAATANAADRLLPVAAVLATRTAGTISPFAVAPPTSPSINIISPAGGEQWTMGSSHNITWSAPASVATVEITLNPYIACLYSNPRCMIAQIKPYVLVSGVANSGSFSWNISGSDVEGRSFGAGQYMVTVASTDGSISGNSASPFTITASNASSTPAVYSLSPASGPINTSVTITGSGFTLTNNSINFGTHFLGSNFNSSNGNTLTFIVPQTFSNCNFNFGVCTNVYLPVTPANYLVSVNNSNGTSNSQVFSITNQYCPLVVDCAAPPAGYYYSPGPDVCGCGVLTPSGSPIN